MLSDRLSNLIAALGISKREFSKRIGFSQSYISMLLNGTRECPSEVFFLSLRREFHVNDAWMQDGVGEMFDTSAADLSDSDAALIRKYRSLPLSEQKIIDDIINAMILKNRKQ